MNPWLYAYYKPVRGSIDGNAGRIEISDPHVCMTERITNFSRREPVFLRTWCETEMSVGLSHNIDCGTKWDGVKGCVDSSPRLRAGASALLFGEHHCHQCARHDLTRC